MFSWDKKKVLITGAGGFIGSHLCEALLQRGDRVRGIDNFDPFYDPQVKRGNLRVCLPIGRSTPRRSTRAAPVLAREASQSQQNAGAVCA